MPRRIIEKIAPAIPIENLFEVVSSGPYSFFLDSAMADKRLGRFSFIGCDPEMVFISKKDSVSILFRDGSRKNFKANPFDALNDIFDKHRRKKCNYPIPFTSGGVGYFSYDLKDFTEKLPDTAPDDLNVPDCAFCFYDSVIAYDNFNEQFFLSAPSKGRAKDLKRFLETKKDYFAGPIFKNYYGPAGQEDLNSNFTRREYTDVVKRAKEYIKIGDIYQVNLSQRFTARLYRRPQEVYNSLRRASPAPFSAYLGFNDFCIMSSSPERFLLRRGDYIETRPIKGTRPRSADSRRDIALQKELVASAKDNAEHIMIVDLERNDLGKICEYGSVKLTEPAVLEKYSNVSHLVSTVSGKIKNGRSSIDCIKSVFPGGSITGAPKIRSMQIIEELEPVKRGVYTGAIGYMSYDGDFDLSIAIRTMIYKDGEAYFSVGGGIVADSDPDHEYDETIHKASGIFDAIGAKSSRDVLLGVK